MGAAATALAAQATSARAILRIHSPQIARWVSYFVRLPPLSPRRALSDFPFLLQ
jgi:hypothetical protein